MARIPDSPVISHWHRLIENFNTSSLDFYYMVEAALDKRRIPGAEQSRVEWQQSGAFSDYREYLRVRRGRLTFDICAAPFGTGFFFSSWLVETPLKHGVVYLGLLVAACLSATDFLMYLFGDTWGLTAALIGLPIFFLLVGYLVRDHPGPAEDAIRAMPFIGALYQRLFNPDTYYKMDTTLMFQETVHQAVLEVLEETLRTKGVRGLSELERKPVLRALYAGSAA